MRDAKRLRCFALTAAERLEQLFESPQEFHKSGVRMEEVFDEYMCMTSVCDRGTLFHLKQYLRKRSVSADVMSHFTADWDFLECVTEGYVSLAALHILGTNSLQVEPPAASGSTVVELVAERTRLATQIVDLVFPPFPSEDVATMTSATSSVIYYIMGKRQKSLSHFFTPPEKRTRRVFGDGLSVERMRDAKRLRCFALTATERLEQLFESPQEFHKSGVRMEEVFDEYMCMTSVCDRGTLFHLKQYLRKRSVSADVMSHFTADWDFLECVTEGYVSLAALHILGTNSLQVEPPAASGSTVVELVAERTRLATQIVDLVFPPFPSEDVATMTSDLIESLIITDSADGAAARKSHPRYCLKCLK
ncbi:hypothetical protein CAPTEDRAFT_216640 [Capitella teleta]|uniref:DUF6589 domain-containing protein n=1 Tax=Capitella teleta TaxID=283909 RepID=R7ULR2_CAPTE|nr:hypothetical protein CAPTEDRAFT_216640 [Capitella teleta]|eukprot:ELU04217.1 hypothetical protein CAPTEDRAFT_216640 [Capitella teleta]